MFDLKIFDDFAHLLVNKNKQASPYINQSDLQDLKKIILEVENSPEIRGLLIYNPPGSSFCLGLDPSELITLKTKDSVNDWLKSYYEVFELLKELKAPKVAIVHGSCLSFGVELILACDYRLASNEKETEFALENLSYSLTPGFYGSQSLSLLLGLSAALDLVLSGRKISSFNALHKGLIDEVSPSSFLIDRAKKFVTGKLTPNRPTKWGVELTPLGRSLTYRRSRSLIEEKTKGFYPVYFNALKLIYLTYDKNGASTKNLEMKFFASTLLTQQSQNVLHLMQAKKEILSSQTHHDSPSKRISFSTHGSGGSFIEFLEKGLLAELHFYFYASSEEDIPSVLKKLYKNLTKKVSKRELTNTEVHAHLARIIPRLKLPKSLVTPCLLDFGKTKDNTKESYLQAYYFHFQKNYPLLEILKPTHLSSQEEEHLSFLANKLKTPLLLPKEKGFSFPILCHYLLEAFHLHYEGNTLKHINSALEEFGFFLSPFEIIERVGFSSFMNWLAEEGLDESRIVEKHIKKILEGGNDTELQPLSEKPSISQKILSYQNEEEHGLKVKQYPQDRINDRCVLRIINATAERIESGALSSSYDADYAVVASCGFPDFWGGPLRYCETIGIKHKLDLFRSYEKSYGKRFKPTKLLVEQSEKEHPFFSN